MDIATTARLGSLLRATISDYNELHEKIGKIRELEEELNNSTPDTYPEISERYLKIVESYLVINTMLKIQYKSLQNFAQGIRDQKSVKTPEISKARLELMLLDIEYTNEVPALRTMIENINSVLVSSGAIRDETLTMVGVVRDGEILV